MLLEENMKTCLGAGGQRPDDFAPVAHVDVVVHHDDEFGVEKLPQVAPHAHHHAAGVAGVGLADADHGQAVAAPFGRQVKVQDFGKRLLQQGHEQLIEHQAQHGRLVHRLAGVGGVVDGALPQGDAVDGEHGEFGHYIFS